MASYLASWHRQRIQYFVIGYSRPLKYEHCAIPTVADKENDYEICSRPLQDRMQTIVARENNDQGGQITIEIGQLVASVSG